MEGFGLGGGVAPRQAVAVPPKTKQEEWPELGLASASEPIDEPIEEPKPPIEPPVDATQKAEAEAPNTPTARVTLPFVESSLGGTLAAVAKRCSPSALDLWRGPVGATWGQPEQSESAVNQTTDQARGLRTDYLLLRAVLTPARFFLATAGRATSWVATVIGAVAFLLELAGEVMLKLAH